MRSWRYAVPVVGALLIFIVLGLTVRHPGSWMIYLACVVAVCLAVTLALRFGAASALPSFLQLLMAPLFLAVGASSLLLFLEGPVQRQWLALVSAGLLLLFWENLRRYIWERERYHTEAIETISLFVSLVAIWLTAELLTRVTFDPSLLSLRLQPIIYALAAAVFLLVVFMLHYQSVWLSRYEPNRAFLLAIVLSLITSEMFWIMSFLPFSTDVRAFLVALSYYVFASLGRAHLDGTLTSRLIRRYAYVVLITAAAVLATARWLI